MILNRIVKKRLLCLFIVVIMLLSLLGCESTPQNDIVILYTNDLHCAVDTGIGYAGLAALKEQYEKDGASVILVDCGDAIQGEPIGTLSNGEYIIDIMNEVGYDVATIGNHEFDYGVDQFLQLVELAEFSYVSCNFRRVDTGESVVDPYTIIDCEGVKIAFVGVTTPYSLVSSSPYKFSNDQGEYLYSFDQDQTGELVYASVQKSIDAAERDGADYIILLSHLGANEAFSPWSSEDVVANTSGIDVVLDGHSHVMEPCQKVRDKDGEWVLITQAGTKFDAVGMLLIEENGAISTSLVENFEDKHAEIEQFITNKQNDFTELLQTVVAKTTVDLITHDPQTGNRRIRTGETNLGNLLTDAFRFVTDADVAILNGGGIRDSISAGDIAYEDILKVYPYGNMVCVSEATGLDILNALELGSSYYPNEDGGFLQVSGITFEIHSDVEPSLVLDENGMFVDVDGEYRVKNVMINGEPLVLDKIYTVASHDYYLKEAGSGMTMFLDNTLLQDSIMLDIQSITQYITEQLNGVIGEEYANPYGQGRIVIQ